MGSDRVYSDGGFSLRLLEIVGVSQVTRPRKVGVFDDIRTSFPRPWIPSLEEMSGLSEGQWYRSGGCPDSKHEALCTHGLQMVSHLFCCRAGGADLGFPCYACVQGRVDLDPMSGKRLLPQSLNRYPYVMNNPINFRDQLGLRVTIGDVADFLLRGFKAADRFFVAAFSIGAGAVIVAAGFYTIPIFVAEIPATFGQRGQVAC